MEYNNRIPEPPRFPPAPRFAIEKKELLLGVAVILLTLLLVNSFLFAGINLGFAAFYSVLLWVCLWYLLRSGRKLGIYSASLLILSQVLILGFARSDDTPVKVILLLFVTVAVNLSFGLMAGHNRADPGSIRSLLDAARVFFVESFRMSETFRGIAFTLRTGGKTSKNFLSVLAGLGVAVPILVILVFLLGQADAAFQGVLELLPDFDGGQFVVTLILGLGMACVFYTRAVAMRHGAPKKPEKPASSGGISPMAVNTVLVAVCFVYGVYLFSQLAYFFGGFSGILPEGYTHAEYARRGFFEMAWLCLVNLLLMVGAISVVKKGKNTLTRGLCLFIGLMTLLLVSTASAKMFMYIGAYGLTRLRVLTEVIMVFLGITTLIIGIWLLQPKLPYMKAVLLSAMILGAAVIWTDVDTLVASYNVSAYQAGTFKRVDVDYLARLNAGARPYIAQLAQCDDPAVARVAQDVLKYQRKTDYDDFRGWNYTEYIAKETEK